MSLEKWRARLHEGRASRRRSAERAALERPGERGFVWILLAIGAVALAIYALAFLLLTR